MYAIRSYYGKVNEAIELKFDNVVSDWYYIKITTKENNENNSQDKYSLEVKLE